jgi:hypothetical protein
MLETLRLTESQEPVRPRQLRPEVPRDLETICLKCLQKGPARRYATATDLADDLRRFLVDEPIRARPVSRAEQAWRWCRRNPAVAALTGSVAALLVMLTAGAFISALWLRQQRDEAFNNLQRFERAEQLRIEALPPAYLEEARARRWSNRVGRRFKSLEALGKAAAIQPS